jgi:hypothetical protein
VNTIGVQGLQAVLPSTTLAFAIDRPGVPEDTFNATPVPPGASVLAAGDWLMTEPDGTTVLATFVTVPTVRPAAVIELVADTCVMFTTLGTVTRDGPVDTVSATAVLMTTSVPLAGV